MFFNRAKRPIAGTVLFAFLAMVLQPLSVLAQDRPQSTAGRRAAESGEEKFSRTLNEIHEILKEVAPQAAMPHMFPRRKGETELRAIGPNMKIEVEPAKPAAGVDVAAKVSQLRAKAKELASLEPHVRAGFDETARHIKDKNLPAEILVRHEEALKAYEARSAEFKVLMDAVDRAAAGAGAPLQAALQNLAAFMAKYPNQKTHTPTDPNNLPWGSPKPVTREPYTSPSQFRTSRLFGEPVRVAQAGSLSGISLPSTTLPATPVPADLAPTEDVQITQAIRDLAASLNNHPVQIYNWVRNNIEFVPSYGSIQGSDMTLQTKRGNSFDTASLLIALFRAANIPARYVYGTIEVPADEAMNWVGGVTVPHAAINLMSQGGIPVMGIAQAGVVRSIRLEHVWVEAFVDYVPSRGAVNRTPDTWVPLDASFKQYQYTAGLDLKSNVLIDAQTVIGQTQEGSTINAVQGWVQNLNRNLVQQTLNSYQSQITSYIDSQRPNATVGDVLGMQMLLEEHRPILLGTLPYTHVATGSKFQVIPDSLRWKLQYNVYASYTDRALDSPLISHTQSLPSLAGKKISFVFSPATETDRQTITSFLPAPHPDGSPTMPSELPATLPGYLIRLLPELRIDGNVVATGPAYSMGTELLQNAGVLAPMSQPEFGKDNVVVVGERRVMAINGQGFDMSMVNRALAQLQAARLALHADSVSEGAKQTAAEAALFSGLVAYFAYADAMGRLTALASKVVDYRSPSFGNLLAAVEPQFYFGVPRNARFTGLNFDIDRLFAINVARNNDPGQRTAFNIHQGMQLSSFEHLVLERLFTDGAQTGRAQSTIQALAAASAAGQRIVVLEQRNLDAALPLLGADSAIKQELAAAVAAGRLAVIHTNPVTIGGWRGFGYAIIDLATGAGAYQISGGTSGGFLSFLSAVYAQPSLLLPPCGDTYLQTLWNNFVTTNSMIPGLALPLFATLLTAGATASAIGGVTILQAITILMTVPLSPLLFPALIFAVMLTALINWLIFQLVFEIGILIGSAVGAAACRRQ